MSGEIIQFPPSGEWDDDDEQVVESEVSVSPIDPFELEESVRRHPAGADVQDDESEDPPWFLPQTSARDGKGKLW